MNFFKRAIKSIIMKPTKTITLLLLVLVLGMVISGAVSIGQAVNNTKAGMEKSISAVVSISMDLGIGRGSGQRMSPGDIEALPIDSIEKIGKLDYVDYYDYSMSVMLESSTLERYTSSSGGNDGPGGMRMIGMSGGGTSFSLTGSQNAEMMDLRQGKISMLSGRTFNDSEVNSSANSVIISKELADKNDLKTGSTITLESKIYQYSGGEDQITEFPTRSSDGSQRGNAVRIGPATTGEAVTKEFEFTVVGIYEPMIGENENEDERQNQIYTTNKTVSSINSIIQVEEEKLNSDQNNRFRLDSVTPIYVLKDANDLKTFKEEAAPLVPENYTFTDNAESFNGILDSMENMGWIASIILYVGIGATLIILSLLVALFLRDRKHEIGIYLSLGEKRLKVVGQIITEVVLIAIVGITLSLFAGNLIAKSTSETMLQNQIASMEESNSSNQAMSPGGGNVMMRIGGSVDVTGYNSTYSAEDLQEAYKVTLGMDTVALFYAAGLFTVLLSTLIPIIYIVKLNPRKIML